MTTDQLPPNLPRRDGSMPRNRGGAHGEVVPRQKSPREEQEEQRRWLTGKPRRQEVLADMDKIWGLACAVHDKVGELGAMMEAMRLTLREAFAATFPEFDGTFADNVRRVMEWREKLIALETGEFSLRELMTHLRVWNEDPDRLPVRGNSFRPGRIESFIIQDLDVPKEEKVAFMESLGYQEKLITFVLAEIEKRIAPAQAPDLPAAMEGEEHPTLPGKEEEIP